jgi:hypothetical protein
MNELGQRKFLPSPKVIRNIGVTLFVLSFVVPAYHWGGASLHFFVGCMTFVQTPLLPFMILGNDDPTSGGPTFGGLLHGIFFCGLLWGSWLTNFTIFFRLPLLAGLIVVSLPWIVFIWVFPLMVDLVPFYFWTLGIAFIHLTRIVRLWPNKPEPTAVAAAVAIHATSRRWLNFLR